MKQLMFNGLQVAMVDCLTDNFKSKPDMFATDLL